MTNSTQNFNQIRNQIIKSNICLWLPAIIIVTNESFFESLAKSVQGSVYFTIVILFLYGYIICWNAAYKYAKHKGYPGYWGLIAGIFNIYGLSFLFLLDNKKISQDTSLEENPFINISISSIIISIYAIDIFFLLFIAIAIALAGKISILEAFQYFENNDIAGILSIFIEIIFVWYLLKVIKQAKVSIRKIFGSFKKINLILPIILAIAQYLFASGFNHITLYGLSFIVPQYVEHMINYEYFSTYIGFIALAISAVIFAPIMEEFIFRGIMIHTIALKKDILKAICISAILFAVVHFRYDIIPLLIMGVITVILYLKYNQLVLPIIYHFFYNLIVIIRLFHYRFLSNVDHSNLITIDNYRQHFIDNLELRILLIALSAPYLLYFIYKNFPRNYDIHKLPYFTNKS